MNELEIIEDWEAIKSRALGIGFKIGNSSGMVLTRGLDEGGFTSLSALRGFLLGWESHNQRMSAMRPQEPSDFLNRGSNLPIRP